MASEPRLKFEYDEDIPKSLDLLGVGLTRDQAYGMCERINDAKVCDWSTLGVKGLNLVYCKKATGRTRCRVFGEVKFLKEKDTAYVEWYGAMPTRKGYGGKFYGELEDYLRRNRCVKKLLLHALDARAEAFWESQGFKRIKSAKKLFDMTPYEKPLRVPASCKKKRS